MSREILDITPGTRQAIVGPGISFEIDKSFYLKLSVNYLKHGNKVQCKIHLFVEVHESVCVM